MIECLDKAGWFNRYSQEVETIILNMRWAGYLLFAIGMINWRYQNSFQKGAPLWLFGLALLIGTYIPAVAKVLVTKIGIAIIAIIVALMLFLAFAA
jgi:hypothetical protein